ncbi:PaREP1 family protein [Acidianus brierleyi]|uniref:PaREP1 family protein n=1 Tax=Acidianus brierleyi TaxID=41673 RepID=UPI001FE24858|nr:PaREP1 family protein [Acidianus brierleyi]
MIHELPKPWYDPIAYKKIRLEEAKFEAEIAKKFVNENLTRNATGKNISSMGSFSCSISCR